MQTINQTSYLLLAAVVLIVVTTGLWRIGAWRERLIGVGVTALVLFVVFLVLRSGASQAENLDEVLALTHGGVPVVVEVYSDF